jgi:predicted nucleic acid-binding protein
VSITVVLDSGPLGLLCAPPHKSGLSAKCKDWLTDLLAANCRLIVPEIADYEIRRELIRAGLVNSVSRLDALNASLEYLPLTTAVMKQAAELWAIARQTGTPTAGDKTIDADVILCAQFLRLGIPGAVIATTNVGHLTRFATAREWSVVRSSGQSI